jgi:hypothetical protein
MAAKRRFKSSIPIALKLLYIVDKHGLKMLA